MTLVERLRAAGCVFAEDEARLLREAAPDQESLASLVARRVAGEPLEYVVGWAVFHGLRLAIEPGVFVPRHRTELLADQATALARPGAVVVDLCCGCGAVGAAVAAAVPVELHAVDMSPAAVRVARRNVPRVYEGDLFDPLPASLRGRVEVLVANVPYVPTEAIAMMPPEAREHEPPAALDGGADGLDVLRRVAEEAPAWLAAGGALLVETGEDQAATAAAVLAGAGLSPWTVRDEETVVVAGTLSR
ncbi:putative protein N(5)-glutamine methyltransferase [Actinophytocola gossypii]|uniref:peptide chain release factor N(5)-glutamine methyltransferase n=1 Tax=Actinophytocola gossypii TaxID=2812003 RepID=A0ABT2JBW7_9PSEU|nr:putative protein N(5)-glutamine methyltransferase [Actinophytocola gossypii]MCT2585335.1 putative protein N(5)-glutamine methyltransferase [Actinophytocola gossypii]